MNCNCGSKTEYGGNEVIAFKEKYLEILKIDAFNWKGLYRCRECNTFWEETFKDDRWGGWPVLNKVDEKYVSSNWGNEYIR